MLSETSRSYLFADQSTLNVLLAFAWCRKCAGIVWAERLPDPADLSDPAAIEWRTLRTSPPKCLTCGSPEISPCRAGHTNSGKEKYEIECPVCAGTIRVLREPVLSLDRHWFHYSPEGDFIQDCEMSPYLGAVPVEKKS